MKESQVLIINPHKSVCTELARHLVLSGVNVHIISQEQGVKVKSADEAIEDFLISSNDVGKLVSIKSS